MKKLLVALLVLAFISGALFAQAGKEVAPAATEKNFSTSAL